MLYRFVVPEHRLSQIELEPLMTLPSHIIIGRSETRRYERSGDKGLTFASAVKKAEEGNQKKYLKVKRKVKKRGDIEQECLTTTTCTKTTILLPLVAGIPQNRNRRSLLMGRPFDARTHKKATWHICALDTMLMVGRIYSPGAN